MTSSRGGLLDDGVIALPTVDLVAMGAFHHIERDFVANETLICADLSVV